MSQANTNPFEYSDSNKRYYTYNYYLLKTYGEKCAKIPLDCGFTCPNIDGSRGYGGCIYCSLGSAAHPRENSPCGSTSERIVTKPPLSQYADGIDIIRKKWKVNKFIPYLQAYSNTYTSPADLEKLLSEISRFENAVGISIATRADCLENEKIEILAALSEKIPVTVELGLQSADDKTAARINRCHTYKEFEDCFFRLRKYASEISICVHIINGLPGEAPQDMENTVRRLAVLHPDIIKIHLLHVIRSTPLAEMYLRGDYAPMQRDDYINTVCRQLELLPSDIVIERLTGDADAAELLAPLWSLKKVSVLNDIDKELFRRNSYQGKNFFPK